MGREKRELIRGLLRCSRCQEMVPADQFYLLNSGRPRAWCKQCSKEYEKIRKYVRALQGNGPEWVQQILEAGKSAPGAAEDLLEEHLEGVKKKKMGYVKPFHTIPLDWLTPIWCWEVRPRSGPVNPLTESSETPERP